MLPPQLPSHIPVGLILHFGRSSFPMRTLTFYLADTKRSWESCKTGRMRSQQDERGGCVTCARIVVGVKGADLQVRFIEECFLPNQHVWVSGRSCVLECAAESWSDSQVVVCDDNLLRFLRHENGEERPGNLVATIEAASEAMQRFQANLWGLDLSQQRLEEEAVPVNW